MYCINCEKTVEGKFCSDCGQPTVTENPQSNIQEDIENVSDTITTDKNEQPKTGETFDCPDMSIGALGTSIVSMFINPVFLFSIISFALCYKTLKNTYEVPSKSINIAILTLFLNIAIIILSFVTDIFPLLSFFINIFQTLQ